jgi:hypothetical protein
MVLSSGPRVQQVSGLPSVGGLKALGEPAVDRGPPLAGSPHHGPQLSGFRLLALDGNGCAWPLGAVSLHARLQARRPRSTRRGHPGNPSPLARGGDGHLRGHRRLLSRDSIVHWVPRARQRSGRISYGTSCQAVPCQERTALSRAVAALGRRHRCVRCSCTSSWALPWSSWTSLTSKRS